MITKRTIRGFMKRRIRELLEAPTHEKGTYWEGRLQEVRLILSELDAIRAEKDKLKKRKR